MFNSGWKFKYIEPNWLRVLDTFDFDFLWQYVATRRFQHTVKLFMLPKLCVYQTIDGYRSSVWKQQWLLFLWIAIYFSPQIKLFSFIFKSNACWNSIFLKNVEVKACMTNFSQKCGGPQKRQEKLWARKISDLKSKSQVWAIWDQKQRKSAYFGFTQELLLGWTVCTEVWIRPIFYLTILLPVIPAICIFWIHM